MEHDSGDSKHDDRRGKVCLSCGALLFCYVHRIIERWEGILVDVCGACLISVMEVSEGQGE